MGSYPFSDVRSFLSVEYNVHVTENSRSGDHITIIIVRDDDRDIESSDECKS